MLRDEKSNCIIGEVTGKKLKLVYLPNTYIKTVTSNLTHDFRTPSSNYILWQSSSFNKRVQWKNWLQHKIQKSATDWIQNRKLAHYCSSTI